jgi:hypothetical protein
VEENGHKAAKEAQELTSDIVVSTAEMRSYAGYRSFIDFTPSSTEVTHS